MNESSKREQRLKKDLNYTENQSQNGRFETNNIKASERIHN